MSERDILIALWTVCKPLGLEPYHVHYDGDRMEVEGLAHELAHAIEAGRHFESRIRAASAAVADEHEIAALRIQAVAMRTLGLPMSLRRLWPGGNWRGDQPPWSRAVAPLTRREKRCVRRFVAAVRRYAP